MLPPGTPAAIRTDGDDVDIAPPFAWLADVWVPGLAVLLDRFVLDAAVDGPRLVLDPVGPEADRQHLVITRQD